MEDVEMRGAFVIRRSGIWNSRAPLNDYLAATRENVRCMAVLGLAICEADTKLKKEKDQRRTVKKSLSVEKSGKLLYSKFLERYQDTYPRNGVEEFEIRRPMVSDMIVQIDPAISMSMENFLIRQFSIFEQFIQCWYLNMCLSILEADRSLNTTQVDLLWAMTPFSDRRRRGLAPTDVFSILRQFPGYYETLRKTPRMRRDRLADSELQSSDPAESVLTALQFWKDFRNLVIHSGGRATSRFVANHSDFFAACLKPHVGGKLSLGEPLPVSHGVLGAALTAFLIVTKTLNAKLTALSGNRRGHPEAPGSPTTSFWPDPPDSPPLLVDGDHPLSLAWLSSKRREQIAASRGWQIEGLYRPYIP